MCGIAGLVREHIDKQDEIQRMVEQIEYRGPDECSVWMSEDETVALGHARLSIVDVANGHQPIFNEKNGITVIINGEIYNYKELRKQLIAKGHIIKSESDSELIPHLYEEYGMELLQKLNGQFAFCLYDIERKKVFLARDPFGEKPLYYIHRENEFMFSSDIRSLTQYIDKLDYDVRGIKDIATTWGPILNHTIYKEIHMVMPGEYIEYSAGKLHSTTYFYPNIQVKKSEKSENALVDELEELMLHSIKERISHEVPTAFYLSGGIDSALIIAMAKKVMGESVSTFSIHMKEEKFSEASYQSMLANYFESDHHEIKVGSEDILDSLEDFILHVQQPLTRVGCLPMYLLSKFVREHGIKVVLSGEGADELFGGYDIFKESLIRSFCEKNPDSVKRPLLYGAINQFATNDTMNRGATMNMFYNQVKTSQEYSSHLLRWKLGDQMFQFIAPSLKTEWKKYSVIDAMRVSNNKEYDQMSILSKAQSVEIRTLLSNYLLTMQGDCAAMSHAIECRYPFLDKDVVKFAFGLEDKYKIRGMNEKYLVRKLATKYLPNEIVHRKKFPYRATIDLHELLSSSKFQKYFSHEEIEKNGLFHAKAVDKFIQKLQSSIKITEKEFMMVMFLLSMQIIATNNREE